MIKTLFADYYIWIPIQLFMMVMSAYFSNMLNKKYSLLVFILGWALNVIPLWLTIAKYSNRLVFDGLLYDAILCTSYTIAIIYFTGDWARLSYINFLGVFMVIGGLILFQR